MTGSDQVTVIVVCRDQGRWLSRALGSVASQELRTSTLVVDAASTDVYTRQVLSQTLPQGAQLRSAEGGGRCAAWNLGARGVESPFLLFLDSHDCLHSTALERALQQLSLQPQLALVVSGLGTGEESPARLLSERPRPWELLALMPPAAVALIRRSVFQALGGFEPSVSPLEILDLWTRAVAAGHEGLWIQEPLLLPREPSPALQPQQVSMESRLQAETRLYERHQEIVDRYWSEILLGKERAIQELRSCQEDLNGKRVELEARLAEVDESIGKTHKKLRVSEIATVDMGELDRTEPLSPAWGLDRGVPIDRYYIADFLNRHRDLIRGRVLEVKEPVYTEMFGGLEVEKSDVLDIFPDNPRATVIGDLCAADHIPDEVYDCFVLTQTLNIIYDVPNALRHAWRILKPGGVLLCTVSALNRISYEDRGLDGDYWRFTEASLRELFSRHFLPSSFQVVGFGNVLTCAAFLYGLAHQELSGEQLDQVDPFFPLVYGIVAEKT